MSWRVKSIDQIQAEHQYGELKRSLGVMHLLLLGIGCTIGAGIFVRTGNAAALHAGPAVTLSFALAGVVCTFVALCYAELASVLPVSGSAYTYAYATIGEFGAWIMGCLLLLEYGLAGSVVAVGWSGYAVSLLHDMGFAFPAEYTQAVGKLVVAEATSFNITNPLVSLSGVTAPLADGTSVQFLASASAHLSGVFQASLAAYDVVGREANAYVLMNAVDITLQQDTQGVLATATRAFDPATGHMRSLAAGSSLIAPLQATVQLPAGSVAPLAASHVVASVCNLPAVAVVAAVTLLLVVGVTESATANNIIVVIKVCVILAFIVVGAFFVKVANWQPFIVEPPGEPGRFGWSGILRATTIVFFAYIGFEAVSTAGQEARNPKREMPFGILGSLLICTVLYVATAAVLTGVISFAKLDVAAPVAMAVDTFGPQWSWLAKSIKIGALAGLSSGVLVVMFGQTRVFYAMARDGLMPGAFAKVHPRLRTPWINTLIVGALVAAPAAAFDINTLGDLTSVGTLAAFAMVCFSVIWLRRARPDLPRQFRAPFYPITPILGIVSCIALIVPIEPKIKHFFAWFIGGAGLLYFLHAYWSSALRSKSATSP